MAAVILDSNVLRGISPGDFSKLGEAEAAAGIRGYGDVWTLMELLSHLAAPTDPAYRQSRVAIQRYAKRSLMPAGEPARVVAPSEIQMSRLTFGNTLDSDEANVVAHLDLGLAVATADDSDDLSSLRDPITAIASHVTEKEEWFASYFSELRAKIEVATTGATTSDRNKQIREYTRSEEAHRLDARAHILRAFDQRGLAHPADIPQPLLENVALASRASSFALEVLLERVLCDGANLAKSHIRNLLWDQEVAASAGQYIDGSPILLVTRDGFFREAAARGGFQSSVLSPAEYASRLGIDATSLA